MHPDVIYKSHSNTLKSAGLSSKLVPKNLANAFINKNIKIKLWYNMSDDEIIEDLTQIKEY